ncbi:hypothetical protein [Neptunomonas japonica]|uniref:hypothetical protein n=1 Tax=Neptunomonas japonica TaxID=417574 RepID=UPI000423DE1D|nr:hypothetical protein [Neptunomonas japonica]
MNNSDEVFGAVSVYGNRGANQSAELPVKTTQDDLLHYELLTLATYESSDIEDDSIEVCGEDANGNEGCWTVSITQLARLACGRINQQGLRVKELEAHLFAVTESLKNFTHAAKTGEGLMQAVMSAETVLESTPKQSLESVTRAGSLDLKARVAGFEELWKEVSANAVVGLSYAAISGADYEAMSKFAKETLEQELKS